MKLRDIIKLIYTLWKNPLFQKILPVLTLIGRVVTPEVRLAYKEYIAQAETKDGWTSDEKRAYVIGRLGWIRSQQQGDELTDSVVDAVLSLLIKALRMSGEKTTPWSPVPPVGVDPYFRPLDDDQFVLIKGDLKTGDAIYHNKAAKRWWVMKRVIGAPVPEGYVLIRRV